MCVRCRLQRCCLGINFGLVDAKRQSRRGSVENFKAWHACKLIDREQCSQTRIKTSEQNLQSFTRFSQIQLSRVCCASSTRCNTAAGTSEAQEESHGRSISASLAAAASSLLFLSITLITTINIAKGWINETPQPFKQPTANAANSGALVVAVSLLVDLPTESPKRRVPAPPPRRRQRLAHPRQQPGCPAAGGTTEHITSAPSCA